MNNFYDALEICLHEIERGADVDTVLFRYPEFTNELRPILETALKAKNAAVHDLSPDVIRRNRAKVMGHAAQLREAKAQPARGFWPGSIRRALVSLAVIALLFIGGTGLVRAASTTVPGDNLYPIKRTWEDVHVLFTFDVRAREALEVEYENERLEEISVLFREGRSAEVDFIGVVTRQDGDLWLVSGFEVVISPDTDLHDGWVSQGDAVRVRGVTRSDWTVLAERVDLLGAGVPLPEFEQENNGNENDSNEDNSGQGSGGDSNENSGSDPDEITIEGTVDSINGNIVVVDGMPMNISGAEIRGDPAAGRRVKVDGYFNSSGIFIVTRIEFLEGNSGGGNSGSNDNDDDNDDDGNDNGDDDNDNDNDNDADNDNDNDHSGSGGGGGDDDNDGGGNSGSGGGDDNDDDDDD